MRQFLGTLHEGDTPLDDQGSDFVVRPIRWPWNVLIDNARLVAEAREPDYEAAAEAAFTETMTKVWGKGEEILWENAQDWKKAAWRITANAAVAAALRVEPGTPVQVIVVKDDGQTPQD